MRTTIRIGLRFGKTTPFQRELLLLFKKAQKRKANCWKIKHKSKLSIPFEYFAEPIRKVCKTTDKKYATRQNAHTHKYIVHTYCLRKLQPIERQRQQTKRKQKMR